MSSTTVVATCLCKAHKFTTNVPTSSLPLNAYACHCTSCRHNTGALCTIDAEWPEPRSNVNTSKLGKYSFSSRFNVLFCKTCSTPLFFEGASQPHDLIVFVGALQNHDGDIVRIKHHIFVGDTIDGGASSWLRFPNADGSEAKRYKERNNAETCSIDWPSAGSLTGYASTSVEKTVPIICRCKGISFLWHRGDYEGKTREELPWYIDPTTYKSIAGFDACDSCRLSAGVDVFHWTYSELKNISYNHDASKEEFPINIDELKEKVDNKHRAMGTLKYYESSKGVQRYFCGNCSATVFYAVEDRPDIVDVAIGLLDAPDGARAESWLSWSFGKVGWITDTNGGWRKGLMDRVEKESEAWRIERGYPKNWRRQEREEAEARGEKYY